MTNWNFLLILAIPLMTACSTINKKEEGQYPIDALSVVQVDTISIDEEEEEEEVQVQYPKFPYEEQMNSKDSDGYTLIIGDDGDGYQPISARIRYPQLPDYISANQFADSLLLLYNGGLAFSHMSYDLGTADRYMDSRDITPFANEFDLVNLSGIANPKIRKALQEMGSTYATWIRTKKEDLFSTDVPAIDDFYEVYNPIGYKIFDRCADAEPFDPAMLIADYESIHAKAITDTLNFCAELYDRVAREKDFEKRCILAREFAYATHKSQNGDYKDLVAVIDPLLQSGSYSPYLRELWLIWRATLQIHLFGSRSNYSGMYNLFYSDMKNKIAITYIDYIINHPEDKLALFEFMNLTVDWDIVRNSGYLLGNNANLDEMLLIDYVINPKLRGE